MKELKGILIAVLLGITIFSGYKYILSIKEKNDLVADLAKVTGRVTDLEAERQVMKTDLASARQLQDELTQANQGLKNDLQAGQDKMAQLSASLLSSQKSIEDLNARFLAVEEENQASRAQIDSLKLEVAQVLLEKENLQARFNSIDELKKALKDLRLRKTNTPTEKKTINEVKDSAAEDKTSDGNGGFIVKDGKFTYLSRVRIEVEPLSNPNP